MSTAIVWFRRDLRLHDQPALHAACAHHAQVLCVYIHAPEEEGEWVPGGAQRWWLHYSLGALADELAAAGSPLVIRTGPSATALQELIGETGATAVYWNRCYEPALIARDRDIKASLRSAGIAVTSYNGALLHEPTRVATGAGNPYRVFTPFWRRLCADGLPREPLPAPAQIPAPTRPVPSATIASLGLLPTIRWDTGLEAAWTPGERGALERLDHFVQHRVHGYRSERERPATAGTSALSPHLHCGELSPRQVLAAVGRGGADGEDDGAATFCAEIGWREFAHHLLYHFPHTATEPLNERFRAFPWRDARGEAAADLAAWQAGRTGIPLVDAGMRQLWHQGWMHNRVRMVVASFLTKNLRLHWLEGARWFWDTLVDADLASNTLGWQWAGGCGADAAPYFRIFNPVRQGERFDADGTYVRHWVPELASLGARDIHAPWQASRARLANAGVRLGREYPEPIVDLAASRQAALAAFQQLQEATR